MKKKPILLRSGTLVTEERSYVSDLLIDGEQILDIGPELRHESAEVVDVVGKLILPGGIDPHTHFDLPMFDTISSDDHYSGHKAAAFGGTTTVIDFIPQDFPTLKESIEAWHTKADDKAAIDFGFHMNITNLEGTTLREIPTLLDEGITTLKVFTAYNGRLRLQDGEIFQVMRVGAQNGMLTMLHAENGDVIDLLTQEALQQGHHTPIWHARTRPAWGAVDAVLRGIALAEQAQSPLYIVHLNTGGGLDMLRYGRSRGLPVMGETCPQYLFFTEEDLARPDGAKWICSPPMRTEDDNLALMDGLSDNSIQVLGTDHCPFFFDGTRAIQYEGESIRIPGKELGVDDFTKIPNGLPGVGDRMPILWTHGVGKGNITENQFVALTSSNPAKIFGLYPRKGALMPGSDADIVVWDPDRRVRYGVEIAQHRTDYNLFEGWEIIGFPTQVYLRGHLIVEDGNWFGKQGMGKYLQRTPGAEIL
jgi:dihydropyrimidinase